MEKRELNIGDILQINPDHENFPGFFLIVTEPTSFGALGYLLAFCNFDATRYKGKAYLRVKFEEVEWCGQSYWIDEREVDGMDDQD